MPRLKELSKPILIAFIGKSAAGKDTLAKEITEEMQRVGNHIDFYTSYTTRPQREGEQEAIDYFFTSEEDFSDLLEEGQLLETTTHKGWFYGHPLPNNDLDYMVGVFDLDGIQNIYENYQDYFASIIVFYINANFHTRLKRSIDREHKFKLEYIRRALADSWEFSGVSRLLERAPIWYKEIENNNKTTDNAMREIRQMIWYVSTEAVGNNE